MLSIKPEFVDKILSGEKTYEFRKAIPAAKQIDKVFIYSSSPVQRIVGWFEPGKIHLGTPHSLWRQFSLRAGIGKVAFFDYFRGRKQGYALEINRVHQFSKPLDPKESNSDFYPPQSFCYVEASTGMPPAY